MKINSEDILQFLSINNISFQGDFQPGEHFEVASLFNPVDNGFYFYNSENIFSIPINHSLILVEHPSAVQPKSNNQFIIVKGDVQLIYYQIISHYYSRKSSGIIAKTTLIDPKANIGKNVQIDDFCIIENCTIGDNVIINSHCKIHENTIIGENTIIESASIIGTQGVAWVWDEFQTQKIVLPQLGKVEIGSHCFLGANTIIVRGSLNEATFIDNHTLMAPACRIGHGTKIGKFVHFANNVVTGGNAIIGDYSFVGSSAVIRPKVKISPKTIIGAGSVVVADTSKEGLTLMGVPAKETISKNQPSGMPKPKK